MTDRYKLHSMHVSMIDETIIINLVTGDPDATESLPVSRETYPIQTLYAVKLPFPDNPESVSLADLVGLATGYWTDYDQAYERETESM